MAVFFIVFWHEILLSFRNFGKILANFLFFLISLAIFSFMASDQHNQGSTAFYAISAIWFSLLFSLVFSATDFLKKDFEDGEIEQALVDCANFEVFILAKIFANWLVAALPILISSALIFSAISANQASVSDFVILIFLASLIINFICTFCGSLSILGNSAPMIAVIALPLIIPTLLIAYSGVLYDFWASFKILGGICVLSGAIGFIATAKIVKIAAE
jgi:heme exporter protein CcmB